LTRVLHARKCRLEVVLEMAAQSMHMNAYAAQHHVFLYPNKIAALKITTTSLLHFASMNTFHSLVVVVTGAEDEKYQLLVCPLCQADYKLGLYDQRRTEI